MRPKSLLLLTLALGCGLVASIGISQVLDRRGGQGQAAPETEAIYIAKTDINLGDKLTEELINLEEWPKDKIPPGAVRDLEALVDRHPRTKIYQGEPILEVKLVSSDARDNPAQQVPPGYRVVSVRVDAHTGGAGLLRPGDRVDVQLFVNRNSRSGVGVTKAKTILREVRVFAVDQDFRRRANEEETSPARTVSLVVTPEQADRLTLASRLGEINLTIRNPDDRGNPSSDGASIDDLFAASRADRENERRSVENFGQKTGGFLSFVKQLTQAASMANGQAMASAPWTMLVMEGTEVREVELKQENDSSVWKSSGGAAVSPSGGRPNPALAPAQPADEAGPAGPADDDAGTTGAADDSDDAADDPSKAQPAVDDDGFPIFTGGNSDQD